jgi:hypothetical protein
MRKSVTSQFSNTARWTKHGVCVCVCVCEWLTDCGCARVCPQAGTRKLFVHQRIKTSSSSWLFQNCGGPWSFAKARDLSRNTTCIKSGCRSLERTVWVEYEWLVQMRWSRHEIVHTVNRKLVQCRMQEEDGAMAFHWNNEWTKQN